MAASGSNETLRYRCAVPVTIRRRGEDLDLLTSEVSFVDAFVRTTESPPANSLVRLAFCLPPDDAKITLSAHVTQVIGQDAPKDEYPGFTARFMGLNGPAKDRWESLIWTMRKKPKEPGSRTVMFARPSYIARFQLKAPVAADIRLMPDSVEEMVRIIKEDVPTGNLFIPTKNAVTLGANVRIQLVHPITDDTFPLDGVVRRRGAGAQEGVLVGLAKVTDEVRAGLKEFAESVVVLEDYDIELYEDAVLA